jgi:S1-C subfamily serine protease
MQPASREARGGISVVVIFLIVGGIAFSLVFGTLSSIGIVMFWTYSANLSKEAKAAEEKAAQAEALAERAAKEREAGALLPKTGGPQVGQVRKEPPLPAAPHDVEFAPPFVRIPAGSGGTPPTANALLTPEALERVKKATVHLRVMLSDGRPAHGSGFFAIEPGLILTNAHVVGMLHKEAFPPRAVEATLASGTKEERKLKAELLAVDRNSDLAVLRVKADGLPAPLSLSSASTLRETQAVWIVGFPLGDQLGKEITVSSSSVSSLRGEPGGAITRVQVNGGMHRGNSGGPVVDANGSVVGVAVSILINTQINFAVPADLVWAVYQGRMAGMVLGQPYLKDGKILVPASMRMVDPVNRLKSVGLDMWTSAPSKSPRPAATSQPGTQNGDSPHQRIALTYKSGTYHAEVPLAPLKTGEAYWVQPTWVTGTGETQWATGSVYNLPSPVEMKPVTLALKQQIESRELLVDSWLNLFIHDTQGGEHLLSSTKEARLAESIQAIDEGAEASVHLQFLHFNEETRIDDKIVWPQRVAVVRESVPHLAADLRVAPQGEIIDYRLDWTSLPTTTNRPDIRQIPEPLELLELLKANAVLLPNKQVKSGETWQASRNVKLNLEGRWATGTLQVVYRYLGVRTEAGRESAVVAFRGRIHGRDDSSRLDGGLDAMATIDAATGTVVQGDAQINLDAALNEGQGSVRCGGRLNVRWQRVQK